jgi:ATP-dependent Clp protease protease subunit
MNLLQIENKSAKVKLNDQVHKYSVDQIIEEIEKVYGMAAVSDCYTFGDVTACAENAVDTLEIEIHSPGGSVFEGYRIYNAMRELRERGVYVTAKINTLAASMGSVIAMAADKITIASNGRMMIHDASTGIHGNADAMRKGAEMLEEISDEIAGVYAEKTGKDKGDIRKMMKSETWISAKKAIEMGFADEIFDTKSKVMSILDKFKPDAALVEKVNSLESSLVDAENKVSELTAKIDEVENDLASAVTELTEAKAKADKLAEEKAQFEASFNEAETAIANLTEQLATAQASAETRAAEILATAGVPPVEGVEDKPISNVKSLTEFNALTPAERMSFIKSGGKISN